MAGTIMEFAQAFEKLAPYFKHFFDDDTIICLADREKLSQEIIALKRW